MDGKAGGLGGEDSPLLLRGQGLSQRRLSRSLRQSERVERVELVGQTGTREGELVKLARSALMAERARAWRKNGGRAVASAWREGEDAAGERARSKTGWASPRWVKLAPWACR